MSMWHSNLIHLIRQASSSLPADVETALRACREREESGSLAEQTLQTLLDNVALARQTVRPLCQDTGTLLVNVEAPSGFGRRAFESTFREAVVEAVEEGTLRRNCVETLTGQNTGNGVGRGNPVFHWRESDPSDRIRVALVQKGGGCENVGCQYSLPDHELGADRDLEGVRRCALDAAFQAQGRGCAPGILAVVAGGDRATGAESAKQQFFRHLGERHGEPELADLERRLLREANQLGIGPMGFGGNTTVLEVFVDVLDRLPASFFVTVSYMCWALRRAVLKADVNGENPVYSD
ncbi:MAG: fumarate hydratase [Verrucomicrobiota bacterium]